MSRSSRMRRRTSKSYDNYCSHRIILSDRQKSTLLKDCSDSSNESNLLSNLFREEVPKLKDVTTNGGLLSYRGQHVLLYIPDHGPYVEDALRDPGLGKRFHLSDCKTIKQMRAINRYARYVATTNTSGLFKIVGINQHKNKIEGEARLHVCKNCLRQLNYKGGRKKALIE